MAESRKQVNWGVVIIALITGLTTAVPATLMAWAAVTAANETHKVVNSRMTEMLALTRESSAAKATLIEKAAEAKRQESGK